MKTYTNNAKAELKKIQKHPTNAKATHDADMLTVVCFNATGITYRTTDNDCQIETGRNQLVTEAIAVNTKTLIDTFKSFGDHFITLDCTEYGFLKVSSGTRTSKLPGTHDESIYREPMKLDTSKQDIAYIEINKQSIQQIKAAAGSMAKGDVRYYLNGMLLDCEGGKTRLVATDGHRLTTQIIANYHGNEGIKDIVRHQAITLLVKSFVGFKSGTLTITRDDKYVRFEHNGMRITSTKIDGRFPDYNRVIPVDNPIQVTVDRKQALESIKSAIPFTNPNYKGVKLVVNGNLEVIACNAETHGEAYRDCLSFISSNNMPDNVIEIGFNATYLVNALNTTDDETVSLAFRTGNDSILIGEGDNLNVVMPMRL